MKGYLITLEGPEGSGKTTHGVMLREYLVKKGYEVTLTHEPGGTPLGKKLRQILLTPDEDVFSSLCELFLYLADRANHMEKVIGPALNEGKVVICDRFIDATVAYQGYGRGLGLELIKELNSLATGQIEPDLTIILDIEAELGLLKAVNSKLEQGLKDGDRLEQVGLDFHRRVRAGYLKIAYEDRSRVKLIAVDGPIEEIQARIRVYADELLRTEDRE